jgi:deoxycytidylate deaminase
MEEIDYKSKRHLKICELAEELAKKSDMEKSKHGAVIMNGNKVIGTGYNKHCNKYCNNKKCYSDHAEVNAIIDAIKNYGKESLYNSVLYVVRITKGNNIANKINHENSRQGISRQGISRQGISRHEKPMYDISRQGISKHEKPMYDISRQGISKHEISMPVVSMHNLRMSKPCENCTRFIIKNNINTVYYSID